ncbi:MAG: metalloregulator ArsR/SmtB family transcription factor [Aggregatilineales bacterium]
MGNRARDSLKHIQENPQRLDVLKLLAHDIRWQLLTLLAESDLTVQELADAVAQPMNTVSYHLKLLRDNRLVSTRQSDADGRDVYYGMNISEVGIQYRLLGELLHPGMISAETVLKPEVPPFRVLFLCTHNSARSQMAEGFLRKLIVEQNVQAEVFSAGSEPRGVHPLAIRAMRARDIDISGQSSDLIENFVGESFDYVITVCDHVREVCPTFPGDYTQIHWSIPDPSTIEGVDDYEIFLRTSERILSRLHHFLAGVPTHIFRARELLSKLNNPSE